jgi:hypothetical protein
MIEVTLHTFEVKMGAAVGMDRHIAALDRRLPDRHGFTGDGWKVHVEGALGELAVAKALNRFWNGSVNTFKGGDLGRLQVRTRSRHDYDLIVRDSDADDEYFMLVTGQCPSYQVHGYIKGADAKQPQWLQTHGDRPAAWFIPKDALTPLN